LGIVLSERKVTTSIGNQLVRNQPGEINRIVMAESTVECRSRDKAGESAASTTPMSQILVEIKQVRVQQAQPMLLKKLLHAITFSTKMGLPIR